MNHDREFWRSTHRYHDLAKQVEEHVTVTHPDGADCFCGPNCPWAATDVTYYEYRGPSI